MRLVIPSTSANESFARVTVASFASQLDPTIDDIADIKTAISEAVTNCIVHGYKNTVGLIYIHAKIFENGRLTIKIRDTGCGIPDVKKAMEPLYSTGGEDRAGLGFTVMESFMDRLRVSSREGKGTTVTMEKIISGRQADER